MKLEELMKMKDVTPQKKTGGANTRDPKNKKSNNTQYKNHLPGCYPVL